MPINALYDIVCLLTENWYFVQIVLFCHHGCIMAATGNYHFRVAKNRFHLSRDDSKQQQCQQKV